MTPAEAIAEVRAGKHGTVKLATIAEAEEFERLVEGRFPSMGYGSRVLIKPAESLGFVYAHWSVGHAD